MSWAASLQHGQCPGKAVLLEALHDAHDADSHLKFTVCLISGRHLSESSGFTACIMSLSGLPWSSSRQHVSVWRKHNTRRWTGTEIKQPVCAWVSVKTVPSTPTAESSTECRNCFKEFLVNPSMATGETCWRWDSGPSRVETTGSKMAPVDTASSEQLSCPYSSGYRLVGSEWA